MSLHRHVAPRVGCRPPQPPPPLGDVSPAHPSSPGDGSDAADVIAFLRAHDDLAAKIARNGYELVHKHLQMSDVSAYWEDLLRSFAALAKYEPSRDESFKHVEVTDEEPQFDITQRWRAAERAKKEL